MEILHMAISNYHMCGRKKKKSHAVIWAANPANVFWIIIIIHYH